MELDYKENKGFRLLQLYERLSRGEVVSKAELAQKFAVTDKTIQRDIEELRAYLAETRTDEGEASVVYDRARGGYLLTHAASEWLTNEDVLAVCKILLESRAFCKEELDALLKKLLRQTAPQDRAQVGKLIRSERHYYVPLRHGKKLLSAIWELSQHMTAQHTIRISYCRQDGAERVHEVNPVAIMFSEYYFYLIAYLADGRKEFPTIFRIDRVMKFEPTGETFRVIHKKRFSDGEFRKRIQFMYAGELRCVTFDYSGTSVEAVLDRLPTAKIISEENGVYRIAAEVYGNGIDMWLRSQGDRVHVIEE
ncbi:helix-turn-helix transcriptional regulator [Selenomonas massiliensis]|uniref:helix-turn-helix transcriptional regulator n=1 Tax=Selenomonas massiliensis TaxID=2058293 RepID=UPI000D0EE2E8|nr:WYL domain-containing protein [Selenomonas massiliensis]